ncbi:MAG: FecR domain-containing protein [Cyclobacteriaceae bacterium]
MDKFNHLLQKYIANNATPQEVAEFLEMVREECNEDALEKLMDERLASSHEGLTEDERMEVLQEIFAKTRKRPARKYWMAAAGLVAITLVGLWLYTIKPSLFPKSISKQEKVFTISGKDYVSLPDGSNVTLRQGSRLNYKESYGSTNREVILAGEAFFNVVPDVSRPFKVHTGPITTTVLGTAFNVNAGSTGGEITVTVTRGKVSVSDERHTEIITPNEQVTVNPTISEFFRTRVNADSLVQWVNDYFILDRVSIEQAAELIGKRFEVEVTIVNDDLRKCLISAWFLNNEDLQQVVEAVSAVRQATARIENGKVIIEGGIGCGDTSYEEDE